MRLSRPTFCWGHPSRQKLASTLHTAVRAAFTNLNLNWRALALWAMMPGLLPSTAIVALSSGLSPALAASVYTVSVFENGAQVAPVAGNGTFTSNAPVNQTRTAGPGGGTISATGISTPGHVAVGLEEHESAGGQGFATATFSTNVTISGPPVTPGTQIPIALNLAVAGALGIGGTANTTWTAIGEINHTDFTISSTIISNNPATHTPGGLNFISGGETFAPLSDLVGGVLQTGSVMVDPSSPVQILFTLQVFGEGNLVDDVFFPSSLEFPKGIDVFTKLPDGYTVNDADAFLFNNRFLPPDNTTPLPAAFPLFATGLGALGLLGWRRKRKLAA